MPADFVSLIEKSKKAIYKIRHRRRVIIFSCISLAFIVLSLFTIWALKEKQIATKKEILARANYFNAIAKTEAETDPTIALQLANYAYSIGKTNEMLSTCKSIYFQNSVYQEIKMESEWSLFYPANKSLLFEQGWEKIISKNLFTHIDSVFFTPAKSSLENIYFISSNKENVVINIQDKAIILDKHGKILNSFLTQNTNNEQYKGCDVSENGMNLLTYTWNSPVLMIYTQGQNLNMIKVKIPGLHCAYFIRGRNNEILVSSFNTFSIIDTQGKLKTKKIIPFASYGIFQNNQGTRFITNNENNLSVWDFNLKLKNTFKCKNFVTYAAFSEDGKRIAASCADNVIYLYDISGNLLSELKAKSGYIRWVDFLNKDTLISFSDRKVKIWPLTGLPEEIKKELIPEGYKLSLNKKFIYKFSNSTAEVKDLINSTIYIKKFPKDEKYDYKFSDKTGTFFIYNYNTIQNILHIYTWNFLKGKLKAETARGSFIYDNLSDKSNYYVGLILNKPIHQVFLKDSTGKTIRSFNVSKDDFWSFYLEKDSDFCFSNTTKINLWNYSGKLIATLNGHTDLLQCILISDDRKLILTGSRDNTARIWDSKGKQICILIGHKSEVTSCSFSKNNEYILTTSNDNSAILWDVEGNILCRYSGYFSGGIKYGEFLNDDKQILLISNDNTYCRWNVKPDLKNKQDAELSVYNKIKYGIETYHFIYNNYNIKKLHEAALAYSMLANTAAKSENAIEFSENYAQILMKCYRNSPNNKDFLKLCELSRKFGSDRHNYLPIIKLLNQSFSSITHNYPDDISDLLGNLISSLNTKLEFEKSFLKVIDEAILQNPKNIKIVVQHSSDYSYYLIKEKKFELAVKILEKLSKLEPENQFVISNLALSYVLTNQMDKALPIYKKHMNEEFIGAGPFKQAFLDDIADFEKDSITCIGFKTIKEILNK